MKHKSLLFGLLIALIVSVLVAILIYFLTKKQRKDSFASTDLAQLHGQLKLMYGNFREELPEQQMIFKHIQSNSKILELGANIGRSSVIANALLSDKTKHLCVESIPDTCQKLKKNRDLNNLKFQVFEGAISNSSLYQDPNEWRSSKKDKKGYVQINTKPYSYIVSKYNIDFDTLIADCEGCVTTLLEENEYILNNIKLIIIEHDFNNKKQLDYFSKLMSKYNFTMVDKITKKSIGLTNWKDGVQSDPIFVSVWKKLQNYI